MRILFCRFPAYFGVQNSHPENIMVPMEFAYMASICKSLNIEVEMLDLEAKEESFEEIKNIINSDFDYIVLRAKTPSYSVVNELFHDYKGKIIGVGHLFSTKGSKVYETTTLPLLCGIKGEADYPFKLLMESIIKNEDYSKTPNIIFKHGDEIVSNPNMLIEDLDDLPAPAFEMFDKYEYYTFYATPFGQKKNYGFLMQSRGCPYSCTFCSPTLRNSYGKNMRYHSIDRVVSDMKKLKEQGKTIIFFRDDILTINRQRTIELCKRLIEENIGISWSGQTHINNIDKELLSYLKKAGCVSLGFGLESGSEKILKTIKKTNKIENAKELINYAKKINLKTNCFFLIGCPGENKEDHQKTLDLLKNTMPDLIQVAFFTPYPGSEDYRTYYGDEDKYDTNLHHYNNYKFNKTELEDIEIQKIQKKLYLTWLFNFNTLKNIVLSLLSDLLFNPKYFVNFLNKGFSFFFRLISFNKKKMKEVKI